MTDSALIRFFVVAIHPISRLFLSPAGNSVAGDSRRLGGAYVVRARFEGMHL